MQSPAQEAWNRLRSLIKSCLSFAELKDMAGAAGLEVERLAHLQQRSMPQRGASKSELLDAIGTLFAARDESDRVEILEIFVRECLRQFPDREPEFGNALRRSGIILTEQRTLYVYATEEAKPASNPVMVKPDSEAVPPDSVAKPLVFVSYSHADTPFKIQLEKHLKALSFEGKLSFWSDELISPGTAWFQEIAKARDSAVVAVLLVTADFLASDFIREHEIQPILKRHSFGDLKLIWVPVRACNWEETPLREIQTPISPEKPIAEMKAERDKAWVKVCQAIKQATADQEALYTLDAETSRDLQDSEIQIDDKPQQDPNRRSAGEVPKENSKFPRLKSPGEQLDGALSDMRSLRRKIASCDNEVPLSELSTPISHVRSDIFNYAHAFLETFDGAIENPQPAKLPGLTENCPPGKWALRPDLWPAWDLVNAIIEEITRIMHHPSFQESERRWLVRNRPWQLKQ